MRYFKYAAVNCPILFPFIQGRIYKGTDVVADSQFMVSYYADRDLQNHWEEVSEEEYLKQEGLQPNESTNIKPYYKGKSSLYLFAEEYGLNSWEFDIIKRVIRCRHKGSWLEDLEKTKGVIDIYIKECKEKYNVVLPR